MMSSCTRFSSNFTFNHDPVAILIMSLTQIDQHMIYKENTDEIDKKSHDTHLEIIMEYVRTIIL